MLKARNCTDACNQYDATDLSPLPGVSYYRLRMVDNSGSVRMSDLKMIMMPADNNAIQVTPNPSRDRATITINTNSSKQSSIQIVNGQGLVVYRSAGQLRTGANAIELPVSKLAPGRYIVTVSTGQELYTKSIIVIR